LRAAEAKAKFIEEYGPDALLRPKTKEQKTKQAKKSDPDDAAGEVEGASANADENKKRKSEAVAAMGMEGSAKTSRKKKSRADAANTSKAKEEKNASNAVLPANDHAAAANVMKKGKVIAAAEAALKKADKIWGEEFPRKNAATSKKPADSSLAPNPDAATVVAETLKDAKEMNTRGEGGAPHAKRAKDPNSFDRVVVHHPNKVAIEISTQVEGTVLSWAQLARHFVEKSLLHPPQLFDLLASLSPHKHTSYLFRYADGYASVINAEWASKSITANDNSRETGLTIEANISLKPRDSIGEVMAAAWQRWSSAMEHKATTGGRESFDVAKEEDGVVHVDLVVEKLVIAAEDQIAFGGGGGGETCGDGGFRFTTTQLPYPIDDTRTNVLCIKEHPVFLRSVDKFQVERLVANNSTCNNVKGGGVSLPTRSPNNEATAVISDASEKAKATKVKMIQSSTATLTGGAKNSAAVVEKASENDDTLLGRTKLKKNASLLSKKKKTKTPAMRNDHGSAQDSGKEVKMPTLDESNVCLPTGGVNGSSDSFFQPAKDLPVGWKIRVVPRKSDDPKTKYDTYWFSPQNSHKFNSKRRADRFCGLVEQEGGDEVAAYQLYKMAKTTNPGNALTEVDSGNTDNKEKRKSEAVADIGVDESANASRKKKRSKSEKKEKNASNALVAANDHAASASIMEKAKALAAAEAASKKAYEVSNNEVSLENAGISKNLEITGADAANASKTREEKNASNALIAAKDHAASANIMEKAKALAAAEAASKKVNEVFNKEFSLENSGTSKNLEIATPSPADSSPAPNPDAAAAVVETNKKKSPRKTMKRLEYVLMAQEGKGKGNESPSAKRVTDGNIGVGDEQSNMPIVNQTLKKQDNDENEETVEINREHSSKSTSKKKKKEKKSKTGTEGHVLAQTPKRQENDENLETVEINTEHSNESTSKKKKKKEKKSKTGTVGHI
jgi:hypothetical protein